MSGYAIIVLALLILLVSYYLDLGPAGTHFIRTMADIPGLNSGYSHDPGVFSLLVRAMYLIFLAGIIKLFVSRKKKDDDE